MHFLLPTDGSEAAFDAFKHAVSLSQRLNESSQFTLLVVHDDTGLRMVKGLVGKSEGKAYLQETRHGGHGCQRPQQHCGCAAGVCCPACGGWQQRTRPAGALIPYPSLTGRRRLLRWSAAAG